VEVSAEPRSLSKCHGASKRNHAEIHPTTFMLD
jgi:hypothetical protein